MKGWSFLIFCLTLSFASEVLGLPSSNYTARRISYQKTGDSYNNGYQHGYGYGKSSSSESSESSESKSCEIQECMAPTNLAKLYVANGVVSDDGEYTREPEVICPCAQGSQQFFKPSMYSNAEDSYEYSQLALELYSGTAACANICIRDKDGNFWKSTDTSTDVILVPSCMGGECNIYVGVSSGTLTKDGTTVTADSTHPVDISDVFMLPSSNYLKAVAASCTGCDDIKPEITEKCYGPGYFYNFEIDLEESKSSNEQCENSIDLPSCVIPTGKAQLFVEYGVISYTGSDQQAPQSICHCEGGSLQFFDPTTHPIPSEANSNDELAKYIYNEYDYEECQRVCIRDIDGNFWEGYDYIELYLVPYCDGEKCYTYAAFDDGFLRNAKTGDTKTTSDSGTNFGSDPVGLESKYLKIVAVSCGGCDKIQEIDKCNISKN